MFSRAIWEVMSFSKTSNCKFRSSLKNSLVHEKLTCAWVFFQIAPKPYYYLYKLDYQIIQISVISMT